MIAENKMFNAVEVMLGEGLICTRVFLGERDEKIAVGLRIQQYKEQQPMGINLPRGELLDKVGVLISSDKDAGLRIFAYQIKAARILLAKVRAIEALVQQNLQ